MLARVILDEEERVEGGAWLDVTPVATNNPAAAHKLIAKSVIILVFITAFFLSHSGNTSVDLVAVQMVKQLEGTSYKARPKLTLLSASWLLARSPARSLKIANLEVLR
jgi:hypothetical protein